jgi:hypothetical protein
MRTRNIYDPPPSHYAEIRAKQHHAALQAMGMPPQPVQPATEPIEKQAERHRAARAERAERRYVQPEDEYTMAALRLQAKAHGDEFAATEHTPGTSLANRPPVLQRGFAAAIVEASRVLTSDQKRLYRRYLQLDRPQGYKTGGCFEKVATTARRLGVAPGSVKRNRRILCQYGLLASTPEGITPVRWFPTLPPWVTCNRPAKVAKGKATDRWIMAESVQLDAVLSERLAEMETAKQARAAERPPKAPADPAQICTPESHDLYPEGAQIVPGEGTNCTPTAAGSAAGQPDKALAA